MAGVPPLNWHRLVQFRGGLGGINVFFSYGPLVHVTGGGGREGRGFRAGSGLVMGGKGISSRVGYLSAAGAKILQFLKPKRMENC